nr:flagellar motor switch protein FliG [Treponemataceae bacterium]
MAEDAKTTTASKPAKPAKSSSSGSKKNKDYRSLTGRQKAAIFLVSLGSEISSEVFKH